MYDTPHRTTRGVVRTLLNRNVARDLRRFARNRPTSFERDLAAGMNITLPGVGRVSADPAEARNQFARFVSGDPGATYDALDPVARKKAQIAMAFASKARAGEAWTAFGVALHPDNIAQAAGFDAASASECTVALNLAENGALEVSFVIRRRPAQMQVGGAVYDCGPGSEATAEVDIRVEPEEMERLVGQDFADYDDTPVADFLRTPVEDREENFYLGARQAIPEDYRIEMPVEVKVSADLN